MNKIVSVLIINYFIKTVITENVTTEYETAYDNLFRGTNAIIQKTINELFFKLKLNKNFIDLNTNRMLLAMHTKLKTIASENYETYITAIADVKYYERVIPNLLFKIDTLMDDIFNELFVIRYKKRRNNGTMSNDNLMPNFRAMTDTSFNILKEFIKAEGHSIEGEDSPHENIKKIIEQRLQRKSRAISNFKVWSSTNSSDSLNLNKTRRMFGGQPIKIEKFPFVASLHVNGAFACTGAIISRDMILSAASCVQEQTQTFRGETADSIIIRIGSDYTYRDGVTLQATAVYFHPGYDPTSLQHNLVVIKVQKRARLRQKKKIRRVEFHTTNRYLPPDTRSITLLGWGDQTKHTGAEVLSFTDLDIYNKHDCEEVYTLKYVTKSTFCAGYITKGDGACIKDVGGPAILGSTLIGLVSFGPPICGTKDAPTVFTDLGHYVKWIDDILKTKSNVRIQNPMLSPLKSGDVPEKWEWPPILGQIAKKLQSGVQRLSAHRIKENPEPYNNDESTTADTNDIGKTTRSLVNSLKDYPGVRMLANLLNQITGNGKNTIYDDIKSSSSYMTHPDIIKETTIKQNKTTVLSFENLVKSSIDVLKHFLGSRTSATTSTTEPSFLQNVFGTWNMFEITTDASTFNKSVSKAVIEPNVLYSTRGVQVKMDSEEKFCSRSGSSEETKYLASGIGGTPEKPNGMESYRQLLNPYLVPITRSPNPVKKHPREFSEFIIKRLGEQFLKMNFKKYPESSRFDRGREDPSGEEFVLYLLDQRSKYEDFVSRTSNDTGNVNKDSSSVEIAPFNPNATSGNGSSSEYEFYEYETNLKSGQDDDFNNKKFLDEQTRFTFTNSTPTESIQPDTFNETSESDVKIESTPTLEIIVLNENNNFENPTNVAKELNEPDTTQYSFKESTISYNKFEDVSTSTNKNDMGFLNYFLNKNYDKFSNIPIKDPNVVTQYNFNQTYLSNNNYENVNSKRYNEMSLRKGDSNENRNVANPMNTANEPGDMQYDVTDTPTTDDRIDGTNSQNRNNKEGFNYNNDNKNVDSKIVEEVDFEDQREKTDSNDARREILYL